MGGLATIDVFDNLMKSKTFLEMTSTTVI